MTDELAVRAAAARELVHAGELDGDLALSYVIWPSATLAALTSPRRREWTQADRDKALELVACGASWAEAAKAIGAHKQSVGAWVKARRAAAA